MTEIINSLTSSLQFLLTQFILHIAARVLSLQNLNSVVTTHHQTWQQTPSPTELSHQAIPYLLRHVLSLNLELADSAMVAGRQDSGLLLSTPF